MGLHCGPVLSRRVLPFFALALLGVLSVQAERLPLRTYTTADGLVGDAVLDLLEDSRGFLWIATSSGLSRFDGQVFRNYDTPDGLPSPRITGLLETRDGTIFIGTAEGLVRLEPFPAPDHPLFVPVPRPPGMTYAGVNSLLEDRAGRLWVGWGESLVVFDHPSPRSSPGRLIDLPVEVRGGIGALAEDAYGSLWVATTQGLLRLTQDGRRLLYPVHPPDFMVRMALDSKGLLWLAAGDGLYVFRPEPPELIPDGPLVPLAARARPPRTPGELPALPGEVLYYNGKTELVDDFIYGLTAGRSGGMWVATRGGTTYLGGGPPRHIRPAQGLPEAPVLSVLEDSVGTLWLGSESRGLSRLTRSGFVSYGEEDGLAGDRVSGMFEGPAGELYVATWSRDVQRFDGRSFHAMTPRALAGVPSGWGWNQFFLRDRAGGWWLPTAGGLFRFAPVADPADLRDAQPVAHYSKSNGLSGNDVFRVYEDRSGTLWVSVIDDPPLFRLVPGERPAAVPGLSGNETGGAPTVFTEDAAGDLWMGFYVGGLARVRGGRWQFYGPKEGVPPGFVSDLHVDRKGRLWIGTISGGVARVDDPTAERPRFVRYTTADGLTTHSVRCFAEDLRGHLYIGTSRGIDLLDPESGRVRSFSSEDGLPNNLVRACHAAQDGSLWFGTLHGLARLDPSREPPHRQPVVLLSGLEVRGIPYPVSELGTPEISGLVLAPEQTSLRIDYLAIGLGLGTNLRFQYKLEGSEGDWSPPSHTRSVAFPRLSSGSYRFLVRAVTRDGLTSATPAAVSFRLLPPVWRRPWFVALLAALTFLAGWAAHRLRLRRLLAIERVRTRIAADLHDDVGAGLSRISLLGDLARDRLPARPGEAEEMLGQIGVEARELADATSDIVWAVDPRKDDLASLLVRLRRFAADLLEAKGIRLLFEAPADAAGIALTPETRRGLYLVLKEAVHNVAKHSRATEASLRVTVRHGTLLGEVSDDGVGIDPETAAAAEAAGRRGLPGMHERARHLGGRLSLDSAPGKGTRLQVEVPLSRGVFKGPTA